MALNSSLFELIKSLNRTEKRHFRMAARAKDAAYLKLFDVLDRQKAPDAAKVHQALGAPSKDRFRRLQHYLWEALLDSLVAYRRQAMPSSRVLNMVERARVLFDRRQFEDATNMLRRARKLAAEQAVFSERMLVEEQWWANAVLMEDFSIIDQLLAHGREEVEAMGYQQLDGFAFMRLKMHFIKAMRRTAPKSAEREAMLAELERDPMFVQPPDPALPIMRFDAINHRGLLANLKGNFEEEHTIRLEHVRSLEADPEFIRERGTHYLIALQNLIQACTRTGRFDDVLALCRTMEDFPGRYRIPNREILEMTCRIRAGILSMNAYRHQDAKTQASMVAGLEDSYRLYGHRVEPVWRLALQAAIGQHHLHHGRPERCVDWCLMVLQETDPKLYPRMQALVRLHFLLAHWDLGNRAFVGSESPRLLREQRKHVGKLPHLEAIHQALQRQARTPDAQTRLRAWKALETEWPALLERSGKAWTDDDADVAWWLSRRTAKNA